MGSIYSKLEDYEKALEYGLQAYAYYRRSGNKMMEALVTGGLGDVYDGLHQRDKALDYYTRALGLLRQTGDRAGLVVNLTNRAITYSENKEYDRSIVDFSEAARLADSLGDTYRLASLLEEFGNTYIDAAQSVSPELPGRRDDYLREARKTLSQALAINQKNGNLDALAHNYRYISLLDSVNGNYQGGPWPPMKNIDFSMIRSLPGTIRRPSKNWKTSGRSTSATSRSRSTNWSFTINGTSAGSLSADFSSCSWWGPCCLCKAGSAKRPISL